MTVFGVHMLSKLAQWAAKAGPVIGRRPEVDHACPSMRLRMARTPEASQVRR